MYGGTADGVDLLLWNYHEIWSEIVEKEEEFRTVPRNVFDETDCEAASFPTRYLTEHPQASQEEIAEFVTKQWHLVSDRLAIPIAHERLKQEFAYFRARISTLTP